MATKKPDEPMIGFLAAPLESKVRRTADGKNPAGLKIKKNNLRSSRDAAVDIDLTGGVDRDYVLKVLRELEELSKPEDRDYPIHELTNRDTLQKRGFTAYMMLRSLDVTSEVANEVAKVLCDLYLGTNTPAWEKVKELASDIYGQHIVTANVLQFLGKNVSPREILVSTVTSQCMKLESAILSAYVETLWAMQSWMRPDQREVDMAISTLRRVTEDRPPVAHMRVKSEGTFPSGYQIELPSHPHLQSAVNEYFEHLPKDYSARGPMVEQLAKLLTGETPSRKDYTRAAAELAERADVKDEEGAQRLSRDAQYLANEMGAEALGRRIRRWRQRVNLSATDLAKMIGVSVQAVSSWENGYTPPSFASIKLMAICFGIPAQTLELGIQDDAPSAKPQGSNGDFDERYVEVNLYDVQFSAGSGNLAPEYHLDEEAEPLAFRRGFFQSRGIDPKNARCFRVDGDSMQPYLEDGDIVLVDCREISRIKDGKVYAVRYADELRVKRLKRSFEGDYVLLSDNADYEPVTIPRDAENFAIIGEVRWRAG